MGARLQAPGGREKGPGLVFCEGRLKQAPGGGISCLGPDLRILGPAPFFHPGIRSPSQRWLRGLANQPGTPRPRSHPGSLWTGEGGATTRPRPHCSRTRGRRHFLRLVRPRPRTLIGVDAKTTSTRREKKKKLVETPPLHVYWPLVPPVPQPVDSPDRHGRPPGDRAGQSPLSEVL